MNQIEQVVAAFERKDYQTAAQLIKVLLKQSPDNPWVQLYLGRLHEVTGRPEAAEPVYRKLLQGTINSKIATQARQGIQRLEAMERERRRQAIAQATADPSMTEPGFLILEPVQGEARQQVAQGFSRVMKLDLYTARMQLPSRGWQLYRTGPVGELQIYGQELQAAGVPVFWAALPDVEKIRIFRVNYFEAIAPQPTVVCQNEAGQVGSLAFNWSEVSQRVEGLLPIFEEVTEQGAWGKPQRKQKTLDYVHMWDLHLPKRHCIVRLCDSTYQFQSGVTVAPPPSQTKSLAPTTTRINWNSLIDLLKQQLPETQVWSDFTTFAETTADHLPSLERIHPHIELERKESTFWDAAFQLYSTLAFLKNA